MAKKREVGSWTVWRNTFEQGECARCGKTANLYEHAGERACFPCTVKPTTAPTDAR